MASAVHLLYPILELESLHGLIIAINQLLRKSNYKARVLNQ
jgi:hypothetical protein